MKKIFCLLFLFSIGTLNVNASSIYYTNNNGVIFTREQYDFFTKMYYDGYQEYMEKEDFNYFSLEEMKPEFVESREINEIEYGRATSQSDGNKTLKISKSSTCKIGITLNWTKLPNIKSHDVIGARLSNTNLSSDISTYLSNSNGKVKQTNIKKSSNGFGVSVPLSGNNISITQTFTVKKGGTVYASYQHAKINTSLANSEKYTIASNGYGGVFKFDYAISKNYDGMAGVSLSC